MVHLIKNEEGKIVGWEMKPTTEEEAKIAGIIRDLQFWGIGDEEIVYNGLKFKKGTTDQRAIDIESISWIQKKHEKQP